MKVLIVEDEHKIADSIQKGLKQEGFSVDKAYDGETGYDLASTEDYDVIVLDWMMPFLSGIEILAKLRHEDINTPILMLTARSQVGDKVTGLDSGADDYLAKPFDFSELVARIKALGRRPKQTFSEKLKIDNLELNLNTKAVKRGNKEVDLSKKEYLLLEYLLRNKNKTLTKDQIIGSVWEFESDILPNTVEVYIGYLRNKIDKPFRKDKRLIHTVRGFGYKLAIT